MKGIAADILDAAESPGVLLNAEQGRVSLLVPEKRSNGERRPGYAVHLDSFYRLLPTLWLAPDGDVSREISLSLADRFRLWQAYLTLRRRIRAHDVAQLSATLSHLADNAHTDNDIQGP